MATHRTLFPAGQPHSPADFDPLLARLITSPPRPLPGLLLKVLLALFFTILTWAGLARQDVIAMAPGHLVPHTYLKIIQPTEAGIIQEILVQEGQMVHAGEVLMRMDSTIATADLMTLRIEQERNRLALRRIDAELSGQPFVRQAEDDKELFTEIQSQFDTNITALQTAIDRENSTYQKAHQQHQAAIQEKDKIEQILPIYLDEEKAFEKLIAAGHVSRLLADEKRRGRIEKEHELRIQEHLIKRERAEMTQSELRQAEIKNSYIKELHNERNDTVNRVEKLSQELKKHDHRYKMLELKAPQHGYVKNLATHTAGTVVQPGTILLTLVPANEALRAEVWLKNSDVGFVRPGQSVKLKLAAFPFQKYGMLDGVIEQVSADASQDSIDPSTQQMTYRTLISLQQQSLDVDGAGYRLVAGMQLSADIRLGDRTILEYLLSPIQKAWHEAGRER
jgi:hemolysin D